MIDISAAAIVITGAMAAGSPRSRNASPSGFLARHRSEVMCFEG
jgi:hypothetical protein